MRFDLGTPPFTHIALDLTGPCLVKNMVNKRTKIKCWPLLIICLSTGTVDIRLMTGYSTKVIMDQWQFFASHRGKPSKFVSDQGSQLKAASLEITWTKHKDPGKWEWNIISGRIERGGTDWKTVPAGSQWRNGSANLNQEESCTDEEIASYKSSRRVQDLLTGWWRLWY